MRAKFLAFGSIAGLLMMTAAQADDLPVVVEPFDRSGMCDEMGAGYALIPGTETCMKVTAGVRTDYNLDFTLKGFDGGGHGGDQGGHYGQNDGVQRFTRRGNATASTVTQTEFGPLRTFVDISVKD